MALTEQRRAEQRERLVQAEAEAFAHYGIEATWEPLRLGEPALTTRVVRVGDGPPVVFLHGSTLTSTAWAPLLPWVPGHTLLLVDLPGCGLADPFDYTGVDLASHQSAFVGAVLDTLGQESAALVGASMGGWFTLRFAVDHPDRVTGAVILTAPALALPGARVPVPMALTATRVGRRLAALTPPPSARMTRRMLAAIGGDGSVTGAPDAMFEALGAATALGVASSTTMDVARGRTPYPQVQLGEDELSRCDAPVLFLWGEDDKVQAPDAGRWAAERLPDGRIVVQPGGHGLWFEQPERCGAVLTEFLREIAQQPAA